MSCFIIAEIGVNHNGDKKLAIDLIDIAKKAGANAVKFQTFKSELLVTETAPTAQYQKKNTSEETQYKMLKKLELSHDCFKNIKKYCDEIKIEFISTPFDCESAIFLDNIGVNTFKIGSGDLTNFPLLKKVALTKKKIILSTGMSTFEEVEKSINYIKLNGNKNIVLLHCVSAYPTVNKDVNLKCIKTLSKLGLEVGFSDHTTDEYAAISAISIGASYIEKHITLDNNLPGPDHKASLNPEKFIWFCKKIRDTEELLGDGIKRCMPSEIENKKVARRSLAASRDIKSGEIIKEDMLISLRPDIGISAIHFEDIIGKICINDINQYNFLTYSNIKI